MASLQDSGILAQYKAVLANWNVTGYIEWKDTARDWVKCNLSGTKLRAITRLMFDHVANGGEIDQVPERRPEWNQYDYHYDLRISIASRLCYIETLLLDDDPKDPTIYVVSIHDA